MASLTKGTGDECETSLQSRFALLLCAGALLALPVASAAETDKVTFSKDVAPIFQAKCQSCHEPGSIAPMSLMTYQEARPWAKSIKNARRDAPDAAVAHRPQRRRPEVQERHVAHRRADRTRSSPGSIRARSKATRPTCRRQAGHRRRCTGRASATATDRPTSS